MGTLRNWVLIESKGQVGGAEGAGARLRVNFENKEIWNRPETICPNGVIIPSRTRNDARCFLQSPFLTVACCEACCDGLDRRERRCQIVILEQKTCCSAFLFCGAFAVQ
jgi:hypothetical protein